MKFHQYYINITNKNMTYLGKNMTYLGIINIGTELTYTAGGSAPLLTHMTNL